ncbi:MAG: beta-propeller fold lactonase family protein [Terracidiphilus sp.]
MKIIYAAVPLAAAVLLAGCKGFWDPLPTNDGGGGTTPTTLSSGPFYVLNQTKGQIVAYNISSGSLKTIGTYSITAPVAIAIAPDKNYLYVSTLTSGIFVYNINSSGALTLANNQQALSSDPDAAVQVDTTSSWLIDAFITGSQLQLDAIPLNSNGTYTSGTNVPSVSFTISSAVVKQMVLSPQGDTLFLALGNGGAIAIPFNAANSTPVGTTAKVLVAPTSNQAVLSVAVDPQQRLFYLGETNSVSSSGGLLAFSYGSLTSGTPTQITGSPIASGNPSPSAILAEAS